MTAARQVLGVAEAATYTEELAAILQAAYDREEDGFIDRLHEAAVADEPVELWGRDYLPAAVAMELPLDADGVPIRPGDEVRLADTRRDFPAVGAVDAVGVGTFFAWDYDSVRYAQFDAAMFRHRRVRTLADVRADVADAVVDEDSDRIDALVKEAYEIGAREAR